MIELPEAVTLAAQLDEAVSGKRISRAIANHSPHKWAWFRGDPDAYGPLLTGRTIGHSVSHGGFVEVEAGDARLLFAEGVSLRLHPPGDPPPARHQLLVEFEDGAAISGTVQMYGGLWAYAAGSYDNPYLVTAATAPSPLRDDFSAAYFDRLVGAPEVRNLSAKALLATEQRIPGVGNGVLQDILFAAGVHPKRKVLTLSSSDTEALYRAVRTVLREMVDLGGRDTERDLFGRPGRYATRLSRNTVGQPCPGCGNAIQKTQYLGGSVYFCRTCQPL